MMAESNGTMWDTLCNEIVSIAKNCEKAIFLTNDHGYSLFDQLREQYPQQYLNVGIAEQNLVSVAAGLAKAGYRPYVYCLGSFLVRAFEQIKIAVAYESLPVVFFGAGAGFTLGPQGPALHACEDIAFLRTLPNIAILSPCDLFELKASLEFAVSSESPVYLRLGDLNGEKIHSKFIDIKELQHIRRSSGTTAILASGSCVLTALEVARNVGEVDVFSIITLHPINREYLLKRLLGFHNIITLEEHSTRGGLGSAIAEALAASRTARQLIVGLDNQFIDFCGDRNYLLRAAGLDIAGVTKTLQMFLSNQTTGVKVND